MSTDKRIDPKSSQSEKVLKRAGVFGPLTAKALGQFAWVFAAHVLLVVIWWLGSQRLPDFILPSPMSTLQTLFEQQYQWGRHFSVTALEVCGGFLIGTISGIGLALIFDWSPLARRTIMPLLVTLNMIPKVAMAPLFVVWLGFGVIPNIVITFAICFFPIVINAARGLSEVESDLIDLVRVMRASRWQVFQKIQLPSALPYIFSGMKVASVLAVAGSIVGEFIASDRGLGYLLLTVQATLDTPAMFMALALITLIGVGLFLLVAILEQLSVPPGARLR